MKNSIFTLGIMVLLSVRAEAATIVLDSTTQCSEDSQSNGILVSDVTGDLGGATDCWGTFGGGPLGNDPGPGGSFDIGGMLYHFVAKEDMPDKDAEPPQLGGVSGDNIGLSVIPDGSPTPDSAGSGTWEYDDSLFSYGSFLIVLKAGNDPGYAVWLFDANHADSFSGTWSVAWDEPPGNIKDLSHLAIYAKDDGGDPGNGDAAGLGDRVWEDLNVDGIQDCQDTNTNGIVGDTGDVGDECGNGIPNLPVEAYDPGADGVCNTVDDVSLSTMEMTDADGFYNFDNLTPGTYCVRFTLPADDFCLVDGVNLGSPQFTLQNQGNDMFDSNADPTTGVTGNIVLVAGDNDLTNDAGVICPAKLGDRIWEDDGDGVQNCADTNGNGIIGDAGDIGPECNAGVDNVEVELFECGPDGIPGTGDDIATGEFRYTDIMGFYMFGGQPGVYDLPPGEYYTRVTTPFGANFTTPGIDDDAFDSDCGPGGVTQCIALGSGDIDRTTDCGIVTPPPQCGLLIDKTCAIAEPPPNDFLCDKPIDELSMIWDGPEDNVSIIAYKGDTSAMVLGNVGGIKIGDTVTIYGYAGSPNDVTWVVYDEFGVKIGDSVFHMSCSDADMNGLEDCGKLQGDGKSDGKKKKKKKKKKSKGGDSTTDSTSGHINQWLFEGMVDANETLSCSTPAGGSNPPAIFPMAASCSFTTASADVTYGYTVTNMGDPITGVTVTDDQLDKIGGPVDLDTGEYAQFTSMTTISATTTNVATATGALANGVICEVMKSVIIEKEVLPGSCDDGKATELVFSYSGAPCDATTNYQLDKKGKEKFKCVSPVEELGRLNGIMIDKDADKVSFEIDDGNTVRIFRSDTLGEKLAADTKYTLIGDNGYQSQNLHTSCSKPLAVGDQFGALELIQIINEY